VPDRAGAVPIVPGCSAGFAGEEADSRRRRGLREARPGSWQWPFVAVLHGGLSLWPFGGLSRRSFAGLRTRGRP